MNAEQLLDRETARIEGRLAVVRKNIADIAIYYGGYSAAWDAKFVEEDLETLEQMEKQIIRIMDNLQSLYCK